MQNTALTASASKLTYIRRAFPRQMCQMCDSFSKSCFSPPRVEVEELGKCAFLELSPACSRKLSLKIGSGRCTIYMSPTACKHHKDVINSYMMGFALNGKTYLHEMIEEVSSSLITDHSQGPTVPQVVQHSTVYSNFGKSFTSAGSFSCKHILAIPILKHKLFTVSFPKKWTAIVRH